MNAMQPLVLIIEDEISQREILSYNLGAEGFRTTQAADGEHGLLLAIEEVPDVIVLDWMMPQLSGIEVCRRLKINPATSKIPVIMLSAKSEDMDKVRGLETGADDYVVKPYAVSELMARVRVQLRRVRPALSGDKLVYQNITLDTESHRVFCGDKEVKLGPKEYQLLATIIEKPGKVWSRGHLLDRVWGRDIYVDTRTIDVHVGRLRKALKAGGGGDIIRTVRGAGYSLG